MTYLSKLKAWWHDFSAVKLVMSKAYERIHFPITKTVYPSHIDLYSVSELSSHVSLIDNDGYLEAIKREAVIRIREEIPIRFHQEIVYDYPNYMRCLRTTAAVMIPDLKNRSGKTVEYAEVNPQFSRNGV